MPLAEKRLSPADVDPLGFRRPVGRERWVRLLLLGVPLSGLFFLVFFSDLPLCPLKSLAGIPCPGCGMTRATEAMMHADLAGVLRYHPLAPILAPLVAYSFARAILISAGFLGSGAADPLARIPQWVWGVLGVLLVALWITRMFGLLGGLPDALDPSEGLAVRGVMYLYRLMSS